MYLSSRRYDYAADMWSVGCIFAELLTGEVLFLSKEFNDFDFLRIILKQLGTPRTAGEWIPLLQDPETYACAPETQDEALQAMLSQYMEFPQFPGSPLADVHGGVLGARAGPLGLDLLQRMLVLSPVDRIPVEEALQHPFLHGM